jgi:hypothetical protein
MKKLIGIVALGAILTGCTYSISLNHTQGTDNVMDDTDTTSPTVSPNLNYSPTAAL